MITPSFPNARRISAAASSKRTVAISTKPSTRSDVSACADSCFAVRARPTTSTLTGLQRREVHGVNGLPHSDRRSECLRTGRRAAGDDRHPLLPVHRNNGPRCYLEPAYSLQSTSYVPPLQDQRSRHYVRAQRCSQTSSTSISILKGVNPREPMVEPSRLRDLGRTRFRRVPRLPTLDDGEAGHDLLLNKFRRAVLAWTDERQGPERVCCVAVFSKHPSAAGQQSICSAFLQIQESQSPQQGTR